jgi:hypothetical protein
MLWIRSGGRLVGGVSSEPMPSTSDALSTSLIFPTKEIVE